MNRLKYLRKKNNLTQKQVATLLFMSDSNYAKYENGKIPLDEEKAKNLAKLYNCSISYLLNEETKEILISESDFNLLVKLKDMIENLEKARNEKEKK